VIFPAKQTLQRHRTDALHIVSVERHNDDRDDYEARHKFVIAESRKVRYKLHCDGTYRAKKPSVLCFDVEAAQDYHADVYPNAVFFGKPADQAVELAYDIDSDVEK
jgi:hypothetical protein